MNKLLVKYIWILVCFILISEALDFSWFFLVDFESSPEDLIESTFYYIFLNKYYAFSLIATLILISDRKHFQFIPTNLFVAICLLCTLNFTWSYIIVCILILAYEQKDGDILDHFIEP